MQVYNTASRSVPVPYLQSMCLSNVVFSLFLFEIPQGSICDLEAPQAFQPWSTHCQVAYGICDEADTTAGEELHSASDYHEVGAWTQGVEIGSRVLSRVQFDVDKGQTRTIVEGKHVRATVQKCALDPDACVLGVVANGGD